MFDFSKHSNFGASNYSFFMTKLKNISLRKRAVAYLTSGGVVNG